MIAIMSEQISERFYEKTGINVLSLKPYLKLGAPVSSHADMLMVVLDDTVFCYEEYFLENPEIFTNSMKCQALSLEKNQILEELETLYEQWELLAE